MGRLANKFNRALAVTLVSASLLAPAVYTPSALALTVEEREERQNAKTKIPSPSVGKKVAQAFDLYSQELVQEALDVLIALEPSKEFDKAYVNRYIGSLFGGMEKKVTEAISYLKKSAEPDVLNYKEQSEVLKTLAQLYMMDKQYPKAIAAYEAWMSFTGEEDHMAYIRIANAYYEMKQLDKVIEPADRAIATAEEQTMTPYSLKLASYYERKMFKETIKVSEQMVKLFPEEKRNWVQLGMFYVMEEDYKRGLATMELAYKQGYLEKQAEFKTLAQMYQQSEQPIKAAKLQEKYMKLGVIERNEQNLRRLASYYLASKQMLSSAKYYGEAAKVNDKAELYRRQGQILFQGEKYAQAATVLQKALDKGVDRKGSVYVTLMQSHFYNGKYRKAYAALKKAAEYPSSRSAANSWRGYIEEKARNRDIKL